MSGDLNSGRKGSLGNSVWSQASPRSSSGFLGPQASFTSPVKWATNSLRGASGRTYITYLLDSRASHRPRSFSFASQFGLRTAGVKESLGQLPQTCVLGNSRPKRCTEHDCCGSVGLLSSMLCPSPCTPTNTFWCPRA